MEIALPSYFFFTIFCGGSDCNRRSSKDEASPPTMLAIRCASLPAAWAAVTAWLPTVLVTWTSSLAAGSTTFRTSSKAGSTASRTSSLAEYATTPPQRTRARGRQPAPSFPSRTAAFDEDLRAKKRDRLPEAGIHELKLPSISVGNFIFIAGALAHALATERLTRDVALYANFDTFFEYFDTVFEVVLAACFPAA